jgi:glycerol-3-phosphate acyltransferase PlsY
VGFVAVIGHNYSIFMIKRNPEGKIKLGGGAGGTPAIGAIVGLWWPSIFVMIPLGYLLVMIVGYASVATMSLPIIGSLIFLYRLIRFDQPYEYIFSGLLSEILIIWALRPNIQRLFKGTERLVGYRARKKDSEKDHLNEKDPL